MGQGHHDQPGRGPHVPRPAFDLVARGYDAEQVDGYIHALWRYASDLTARVAAAEAALRHERDRRAADERTDPGVRVGRMLAIAQQMADEIVGGARLTAEQTLFDAVREAGASHPIAQEAREQADKLLADAAAEARRIARERHEDLEAQISEATAALEAVRRQQGELLGALLRLRGMVGSGDFERTIAVLARAGADPRAEPAGADPPPTPAAPPQREPLPGPAPAAPGVSAAAAGPGQSARASKGGAARRGTPAGGEVLEGELYPVESPPVSPPAGPRGTGGPDIVDVEIVDSP